MIKEKNIFERYSKKDGNRILTAYTVDFHYTEQGVKKHYTKDFSLNNYFSKNAALRDAIAHRDRMAPVIKRKKMFGASEKELYTVDELFSMIPKYFTRVQGTYTKNNKVYRFYIKKRYADVLITDITTEDVQSTLQEVASRCTQQQVRNVKTDWHRIFQVAMQKDLPVKDLTQIIDTPVSNKVSQRSQKEQNISEEDFQKFCTAMSRYGNYLPDNLELIYNRDIMLHLLKLMRVTGLRPQEAKALHRSDIDFDTVQVVDDKTNEVKEVPVAWVSVVRSIGSTFTEKLTEKRTKTPQSMRILPVFREGIDVIKDALAYSTNDLIFADYQGNPISSDALSDYLNRVSKACGIKVYAGLMRKSFSADNYRVKVNPAAIKHMMGHKNENMSVNWYATPAGDEVLEAMYNRKYKG